MINHLMTTMFFDKFLVLPGSAKKEKELILKYRNNTNNIKRANGSIGGVGNVASCRRLWSGSGINRVGEEGGGSL